MGVIKRIRQRTYFKHLVAQAILYNSSVLTVPSSLGIRAVTWPTSSRTPSRRSRTSSQGGPRASSTLKPVAAPRHLGGNEERSFSRSPNGYCGYSPHTIAQSQMSRVGKAATVLEYKQEMLLPCREDVIDQLDLATKCGRERRPRDAAASG